MSVTTKIPIQQEQSVTVSAINVEDMAGYIADLIHESIVKVEEIQRTNPKVDFNLGRDSGNKLVLLASVSFPDDDHTLSPMEYTERLIAAEMIKTLVSNKMKSH